MGKPAENPIKAAIRTRLAELPAELAPLRETATRYLRYCSAIPVGDTSCQIAHRPWEGPLGYLITVYPGAKKAWFPKYEKTHKVKLPPLVRRILTAANGFDCFGLSLFGMPPSMLKSPPLLDRSTQQCFDVGTADRSWKLEYPIDPGFFHFGGRDYTDDELAGYFLDSRGTIHAVTKGGTEVGKWSDLTAFLHDELAAAETISRAETPDDWWH